MDRVLVSKKNIYRQIDRISLDSTRSNLDDEEIFDEQGGMFFFKKRNYY